MQNYYTKQAEEVLKTARTLARKMGNRTFACGIEESISRSGGTGFGAERIERGRFTQSCQ